MRFIKKFETFNEEFVMGGQETKPAPTTLPGTKPGTKPGRPSPIRRDKPSVNPSPKAELPKSNVEDVAKRFISELNERGEDVKKYINK